VRGRTTVNSSSMGIDPLQHVRRRTRLPSATARLIDHRRILPVLRASGNRRRILEQTPKRDHTRPGVSPVMMPSLPGPRYSTDTPAPVSLRPRSPDARSDPTPGHAPSVASNTVSGLMRREHRVGRYSADPPPIDAPLPPTRSTRGDTTAWPVRRFPRSFDPLIPTTRRGTSLSRTAVRSPVALSMRATQERRTRSGW
jgi:hypothetical protein